MTWTRFLLVLLVTVLVAIVAGIVGVLIYSVRVLGPDGEEFGLLALACLGWLFAMLLRAAWSVR